MFSETAVRLPGQLCLGNGLRIGGLLEVQLTIL
jgi:hypothetical protein